MEISFEALTVGLFALLPGFVSSSIRSMLAATERSTTASWTVGSIVAALFFNAVVSLGFVVSRLVDIDLDDSIRTIQAELPDLAVSTVLLYLALIYAVALAWCIVTGFLSHLAPQRLLFLARLTPVSPEPTVLTQALAERFRTPTNLARRGSGHMQVPWLKIGTETGTLLGRLRHSSRLFDAHEAFEVFLGPVYRIEQGKMKSITCGIGLQFEGIYTRVRPEQLVEIYAADETWQP